MDRELLPSGITIAIASISGVTGLLSAVSSSLIIYRILSGGKEKHIQNRLLLAMSIFDIFYSIACAVGSYVTPKEESFLGFGNWLTCDIQGFFITSGLLIPGYVSMLAVSSFLSIAYNNFCQSLIVEICMHAFAVLPMLSVAAVGAAHKIFHGSGGYCWVRKGDDSTIRGLEAYGDGKWLVIASMAWTFSTSFITVLCLGFIYKKLRRAALTMRKYDFPHQRQQRGRTSVHKQSRIEAAASNVGKQTFLYVGACVLTYIWSMIDILVGKEPTNSTLAILSSIFLPLQGFWNFLIYIRPRYKAIRRERMELSLLPTLKIVIFERSDERSLPQRRRGSLARNFSRIKHSGSRLDTFSEESNNQNQPEEEVCKKVEKAPKDHIIEDDLDVENMEHEASSLCKDELKLCSSGSSTKCSDDSFT